MNLGKQIGAGAVAVGLVGGLLFWQFSKKGVDQSKVQFQIIEEVTATSIRSDELKRVVQIHSECFEPPRRKHLLAYYQDVLYPEASDFQAEIMRQKIETDILETRLNKVDSFMGLKHLVLLQYSGKTIGIYSCNIDDDTLDNDVLLANVCVTENYRGRGFGKQLTKHAIDYCRKQSSDLYLLVYKDEPWNIEMYSKLGFAEVPLWKESKNKFMTFHKILMKYNPSELPR